MYSLQKAAAMLGLSVRTVRRWMKHCGIEGTIIETTKRTTYISRRDILTLMRYYDQKKAKRGKKKNTQKGGNAEVMIEENLHSVVDAASLLGVSVPTMKSWIRQHGIAKRMISTDKTRVYIAYDDIVMLASLYKRKLAKNLDTDANVQPAECNPEEEVANKLYSISEAASYLHKSKCTIRRWIVEHNIEKKTDHADIRRIYIAYSDVLMLANLHKCKVVPEILPVDVFGDLKEIRGKLEKLASKVEKLASEVEDIKHDLCLYVKRSIYIG